MLLPTLPNTSTIETVPGKFLDPFAQLLLLGELNAHSGLKLV